MSRPFFFCVNGRHRIDKTFGYNLYTVSSQLLVREPMLVLGAGGRGFESRYPDNERKPLKYVSRRV